MDLSNRDVENILKKYDIGSLQRFTRIKEGLVNFNWKIVTTKGNFVLRCIPELVELKDLLFEHLFLEKLKKSRFPYEITCPIRNRKRATYIVYKNRYFWIYKFIDGKHIKLNGKNIVQVAKMMAIIHKKSSGMNMRYKKHWPDAFHPDWLIMDLKKKKRSRKKTRLTGTLPKR